MTNSVDINRLKQDSGRSLQWKPGIKEAAHLDHSSRGEKGVSGSVLTFGGPDLFLTSPTLFGFGMFPSRAGGKWPVSPLWLPVVYRRLLSSTVFTHAKVC